MAASDFAAFYCGTAVARSGADPYRLEPLKTCETERAFRPAGLTYAKTGIDPAPFPPYFFAALTPLSTLPYRTAGMAWQLGIALAAALTVWYLAALTRLPWWTIAPAIFVSVFQANFSVGQLPPFIICALAAAALLLERKRDAAAALAASVAVLEPHVGLPVLLALFTWRPDTRIALAGAAAGALALSFSVPHAPRLWVEYLRDVLPVHAVAEAPVRIQFSAAWLLRFFGSDDRLAVQIGFWQYALLCTAAVALAGPIARRLRSPAAIVVFPAAAAVFGGTFIHYGQTTIALLAAFLFAARAASARECGAMWLAIALVAISLSGRGFGHDVPLVACLLATAVAGAGIARPAARLVALGGAGLALVALVLLVRELPDSGPSAPAGPAEFARRGYDPSLASTVMGFEWRRTAANVSPSWRLLGEKVPVWLGLGMVLATGVRFARKPTPLPGGLFFRNEEIRGGSIEEKSVG